MSDTHQHFFRDSAAHVDSLRRALSMKDEEIERLRSELQALADGVNRRCGADKNQLPLVSLDRFMERHGSFKYEFIHAVQCVDRVFQVGGQKEPPLLPYFVPLGGDKFEGVVKLALSYIEGSKANTRLRDENAMLMAEMSKVSTELESLEDCRESLRSLGEYCGCDHVDSPDDRQLQVQHIHDAFTDLQDELASIRNLLRAFGNAELALEKSYDGMGCGKLIDVHSDEYGAIKEAAIKEAKRARAIEIENHDAV